MARVSSYDPDALVPKVGSRWVWEIDTPGARKLIEVTDVFWNGEEWWVRTASLLGRGWLFPPSLVAEPLNDLSRFWEAVTPVGGAARKLSEHRDPADAPYREPIP